MNHQLNKRIQTELQGWIDLREWHNPYAITLTMKQGLTDLGNFGSYHTILDDQIASSNFSYFMHRLNRKVHGRLAARYGTKLYVFPNLETKNDRLHYHAAIDKPDKISDERFSSLIRSQWQLTKWSDHQVDVQNSANNGWIRYITKFADKENIADSIDWNNVHLPR